MRYGKTRCGVDSLKDFLNRYNSGEVDIEKMMVDLRESLDAFIPKEYIIGDKITDDMATTMLALWANVYRLAGSSVGAAINLVESVQSAVFVSYWLGRRDERLEGMLGGVEMNNE